MWVSLNVECRWFSLFSYVNFDLLDWFFVYVQFISQVNQVFYSFGIALSRMEIKYVSVNAAFILELHLPYSLCLLQWLSPPCCQLFLYQMVYDVHSPREKQNVRLMFRLEPLNRNLFGRRTRSSTRKLVCRPGCL